MIKNIIYLIVLIGVLFEMLFNSSLIINSVSFSFSLCINNLFPSLFPFMILANILMEYGFVEICSEFLKPIMNKIFKVHENGAFVLVLSIISGSPSNAKYIQELLNSKKMNNYDAIKILLFTHFVNPLFILNTIGVTFLQSKTIGLIILFSHYLGNIFVGIIFRKYHKYNNHPKISISNAFNSLENKRKNFITILTNSIASSINTLLIILGVITTCLIITTIIKIDPLLTGILEITQGLKYIATSNLTTIKKVVFTTFLISFGGFSIHAQCFSILSNHNIKYLPYFIARILHGLFSSIIVLLLFKIIVI